MERERERAVLKLTCDCALENDMHLIRYFFSFFQLNVTHYYEVI